MRKRVEVQTMKWLFVGFIILLSALIESLSVASEIAGSAEADAMGKLVAAYQREIDFLAAQRLELQRTKKEIKSSGVNDLSRWQGQLDSREAEQANLEIELLRLQDRVQSLEKQVALGAGTEDAMKRLMERMKATLEAAGAEVQNLGPGPTGWIRAKDLALEKLRELTSHRANPGVYLSEGEQLKEGVIHRFGGAGALAQEGDQFFVLGPSEGYLKVVDSLVPSKDGALSIFLFSSLKDQIKISRPGNWADRFADWIPILGMGLLFAVVGWLFWKLAAL